MLFSPNIRSFFCAILLLLSSSFFGYSIESKIVNPRSPGITPTLKPELIDPNDERIDPSVKPGGGARPGLFLDRKVLWVTPKGIDENALDMRDGIALIEENRYDEAIDHFRNLAVQDPDSLNFYYFLGIAYYFNGDIEQSGRIFGTIVTLDPDFAEGYYYLACIEQRKNNMQGALEYLDKATAIDNSLENAHFNKGDILLSIGEVERAIKEFAFALYLSPRDYASFSGILKAYADFDFKEAVISDIEEKLNLVFGSSDKEQSNIPAIEIKEEKIVDVRENIRMFVSAISGKEKVNEIKEKAVTVMKVEGVKGIFEMNFGAPLDLRRKIIRLEIKGVKGDERVKVLIRDVRTKRSPDFYFKDFGKDWRTVFIDVEESAYNLDLDKIEHIRFEVFASEEAGNDADAIVFIRGVEIL